MRLLGKALTFDDVLLVPAFSCSTPIRARIYRRCVARARSSAPGSRWYSRISLPYPVVRRLRYAVGPAPNHRRQDRVSTL